MEILFGILGAVLWCFVGAVGFVHFWIKEWDFTEEHVPLAMIASLTGPFSWLIGFMLHPSHDVDRHNSSNIAHFISMRELNETINKHRTNLGLPHQPMTDFVYLSNPGKSLTGERSKVLIRTTNEITRAIQDGKML